MSNLSDLLPAGGGAKVITATASGNLATGQTVILQSDGTVKQVSATSVTENIGSAVTYGATNQTEYPAVVFDPDSNKVIVAYRDNGNSNYGTARVGTVSGNSISFGTAVVFESGSTNFIDASYDTGEDKVLVVYQDAGDGSKVKAIVGTVSGTDISFGSSGNVDSNQGTYSRVAYSPDDGKHMVVYSDTSQSGRGAARLVTVSGTSFTVSVDSIFETNSVQDPMDVVYDTTNDKFVVAYNDNNLRGRAKVGTVSGSSISFGSDTAFENDDAQDIRMAFDSSNSKVVLAFQDEDNDRRGRVVIGTVSGTSISFGTKVQFNGGITDVYSCVYDSAANKVVIQYRDQNNSDYGEYVVGTVSGTSISFATPVVITNYNNNFGGAAFDSNAGRTVFALSDSTNNLGKAYVLQLDSTSTNSADFAGITNQAINNSASGEVVVEGGVVTNSQLLPFAYTGSLGSAAVYQSTATEYQGIAFDSSNNKIVVAYKDDSNQHGTCAVGTVSGTSISWGTPVVFAAASTSYVDVTFDSSNNKVVIVYSDVANSEYGTAIVGTVSGTSISFGSEVVFASAATVYIKAGFDSNANKVVVAYSDNGNSSYGTAIVGTVSGTSISFGTEVVVDSTGSLSAAFGGFVFDSTNNKVVIPYSIAGGATYGIVGTVSGTSISFGTRVAIGSVSGQNLSVAFDSNAGKVVINYRDANNSDYTGSVVGTVSGTSISFGTELVIEEVHNLGATTFDSSDNKIIFFYKSSSLGYYRIGTVSGTSISYGSAVSLISNNLAYMAATFDSNQNTSVVVYKDIGNSNYGTAKGLQVSGAYPNLVPNTTYYVQNDGTLSTTSSSVTAGKAMSTNSINLDYST